MRGISERFADGLRRGHKITGYAEILNPDGLVIASSGPESDIPLIVADGNVDVDGSADFERTLSIDFVDPTGQLTRPRGTDLLSVVSSNEVRPYWSMVFPDGSEERVLLGTFGIVDTDTTDEPGELVIRVRGADRSRQVNTLPPATEPKPIVVPRDSNVIDKVIALIRERIPQIRFLAITTAHKTPQLVIEAIRSLVREIRRLLRSAGAKLRMNAEGDAVIEEVPDPQAPDVIPAWTYAEGIDATILGLARASSNERAYNGVIVEGSNSTNDKPVRGEAWDDNPESPTYYLGPYGRRPREMRSELVTTSAQAVAMARGELRSILGTPEIVTFTGLVNPAHEVGDVVEVVRARSGMSDAFILDAFNIPLRSGTPMRARTRERRL